MAIIDLLLQSHSVHDIADSLGVSIPTVYKTRSSFASLDTIKRVDPHGQRVRGIVTVEDPIKVGRGEALSQHERVKIAFGLEQRLSHREIRRHSRNGIYESGCAHTRARQNRQRIQPRKIDTSAGLKAKVVRLLRCGVSPEQISARLRFLYPDNEGMNISHESIYQALYVQGAGSLRQELKVEKALRSGRTSRIPRSRLAGVITRGNKSRVHGAEISLRPPQAEDRGIPGHWEGDLVIGKQGASALITLVERKSRFVLIRRLSASHDSPTVISALIEMVSSLPTEVKTITWDQGSEMANVKDLKIAHPVDVFFADPHSPWQRPSNERTNRDIRWYFPKGTDFATITDEETQQVQDLLNDRPRVVLGGQTPREVLTSTISDALTA